MTVVRQMLCDIFPALSLHCVASTVSQRQVSFSNFSTHVKGSECASVCEQRVFFFFFFLYLGAPGGQRWWGGAGGGRRDLRGRGERKRSRRRATRDGELF